MIERNNIPNVAEFKKRKAEQVEEISQLIKRLDEIGYWEDNGRFNKNRLEPKVIEISD